MQICFRGTQDSPQAFARAYLSRAIYIFRSSIRSLFQRRTTKKVELTKVASVLHTDEGEIRSVSSGTLDSLAGIDPHGVTMRPGQSLARIPSLSFMELSCATVKVNEWYQVPFSSDGSAISFADGQPVLRDWAARRTYFQHGVVIPLAWGHTAWNPCHWALEALPITSVLETLGLGTPATALLPHRSGELERATVRALGVRFPNLRFLRPEPGDEVLCEHLVLPAWKRPPYCSLLPSRVMTFIKTMAETAASNPVVGGRVDVVFVSRSDAARRRLRNEEWVIEQLSRRLSVYPCRLESLPFADQVNVVRTGKVLVGVHGAGLAHLAWSDSIGLVELMPALVRGARHYQYASLAITLEKEYRCIFGSHGDLNEDFEFSHDNLLELTDTIDNLVQR